MTNESQTKDALPKNILSDGIYSGKCKKCGRTIRATNIKELMEHRC